MRPTELRVSMPRLLANAKALRARVRPNVNMMCVVKADAYGHGAVPFARALEADGVTNAFAVAIAEEGIELRKAGVRGMVLVLGDGSDDSLRAGVQYELSQAVDSTHALEVLQHEAKRLNIWAKAHLKLDTGMSRIGVRSLELLHNMLETWKRCELVEMEGCFTHFCVADSDPEFTDRQNERFEKMLDMVRAAGFRPIAHAAASSAMLNPKYQHDMVRAGIALYGSYMSEMKAELHGAQTLVTRPVRIATIEAGDTVGYGRTFIANRSMRVMTLPIGYGDGYPRILSNRASVLVCDKRAPIVGRVCMDMLMADVTDIPEANEQSEVVLLGAQNAQEITADELAEFAETIPYEIMLGWHTRIPRVISAN